MIEIIKWGTKKTCTCNNCGCCFKYENEDIEHKYGKGLEYLGKFVLCPQCDEEVMLEQTK